MDKIVVQDIAFDIDGVISDTHGVFRKTILEKYNFDISSAPEPKTFYLDVPGVSNEELSKIILDGVMSCEAAPIIGSIFALRALYNLTGKTIQFVTARKKIESKKETQWWLKKHLLNIPFSVAHVPGASKKDWLVSHGYNYFVDDRRLICHDVASKLKQVYMFNQPWNQGRPIEADNVTRAPNLIYVLNDWLRRKIEAQQVREIAKAENAPDWA